MWGGALAVALVVGVTAVAFHFLRTWYYAWWEKAGAAALWLTFVYLLGARLLVG